MIKISLLKDYSAPVEKKQQAAITAPKMSLIGYAYIAGVIIVIVVLGYLWNSSGKAIQQATAQNKRFENELREMEALRKQFVELEQKKQESLGKINVIERLMDSQKGPVRMLNAVIQAVPQNREFWLTSLEQTGSGIKLRGETRNPETLPDFMNDLAKSGIFAGVDIEQIERRDEISNFSILCAGRQPRRAE